MKNGSWEHEDAEFGTGSILEARNIVDVYAKTYTVYNCKPQCDYEVATYSSVRQEQGSHVSHRANIGMEKASS